MVRFLYRRLEGGFSSNFSARSMSLTKASALRFSSSRQRCCLNSSFRVFLLFFPFGMAPPPFFGIGSLSIAYSLIRESTPCQQDASWSDQKIHPRKGAWPSRGDHSQIGMGHS